MVLEVVQRDVGGENCLIDKGWAPEKEIKNFKHMADTVPIADQARHAPGKFEAPKKPISLNDAEALIRNILGKWLCSKLR